ncbi:MAG: GNAT family N-acetyltransferase [Lysobacter sp.]|nr:MAG: GNAT family N-acetyltransferase [Lysobacter sp.]
MNDVSPLPVVEGFLPYAMETLSDGRQVLIRPMNPGDADAERVFIEALSPQSRRYRFQEQMTEASPELVERLVNVDHVNDEAFVALGDIDGEERIVGVSRYAVGTDPRQCEIAVTVLDAWQGHGLGTALMRRLIDVARERGIERMISLDFAENREMAHLAHHLGFVTEPDQDDRTQVIHRLAL